MMGLMYNVRIHDIQVVSTSECRNRLTTAQMQLGHFGHFLKILVS
jgi:hypothetical protein